MRGRGRECAILLLRQASMRMKGMQSDVNGDIPKALSPWTTAENDRAKSREGGGGGENEVVPGMNVKNVKEVKTLGQKTQPAPE